VHNLNYTPDNFGGTKLKRNYIWGTGIKKVKSCRAVVWLRYYATSRKVVGSKPDEVNEFVFQFI
jgi:hypothetical protein